jgi:hypothetical protein
MELIEEYTDKILKLLGTFKYENILLALELEKNLPTNYASQFIVNFKCHNDPALNKLKNILDYLHEYGILKDISPIDLFDLCEMLDNYIPRKLKFYFRTQTYLDNDSVYTKVFNKTFRNFQIDQND